MSQNRNPQATLENALKRVISYLDEPDRSTYADIIKYLLSVCQFSRDMPDSATIKQYPKTAADEGELLKLENGNYKMKETARRRKYRKRSSSRGKSRRRSRSRKRSGGRRGSRSGSRRRKLSGSGKRRRRRSSSGKRRKRSRSGRRRRSRRSKTAAGGDVE